MIYDANWVPQSENEYQQRLLATTILLVKSVGGSLTIPHAIMTNGLGGSMLNQEKLSNGDILLTVQHVPSEIVLPSKG
jgi:hypothetical protein